MPEVAIVEQPSTLPATPEYQTQSNNEMDKRELVDHSGMWAGVKLRATKVEAGRAGIAEKRNVPGGDEFLNELAPDDRRLGNVDGAVRSRRLFDIRLDEAGAG